MEWIELIVHTTTEGTDRVSGLLMDAGAAGTMIEDRADIPDPNKPHGIWEIIDPKLIDSMPQYLDDYLGLDEEGLQQKRDEHRFRFRPGTAEELHMTIGIPYDDQIGFRNWIKGWRK